jgi:hypothetical protein
MSPSTTYLRGYKYGAVQRALGHPLGALEACEKDFVEAASDGWEDTELQLIVNKALELASEQFNKRYPVQHKE